MKPVIARPAQVCKRMFNTRHAQRLFGAKRCCWCAPARRGLEINSAPPNGGGTQLALGTSGRPRAAPRCL
eukprot:13469536-Alexandrium_andersonii.AAC.1